MTPIAELGGAVGRSASDSCRQGQHDLCADPECMCRHHGRVIGDVSMPTVALDPCPECAAGKHINCLGETWDDEADDTAPCPCAEATPHEVGR